MSWRVCRSSPETSSHVASSREPTDDIYRANSIRPHLICMKLFLYCSAEYFTANIYESCQYVMCDVMLLRNCLCIGSSKYAYLPS